MKKVKVTIEFLCEDVTHPHVIEIKDEIINGVYAQELALSGIESGITSVTAKWEEEEHCE